MKHWKSRKFWLTRFQLHISICSCCILTFLQLGLFDGLLTPFLSGFFSVRALVSNSLTKQNFPCMAKLVNQVHPDWMPTLCTSATKLVCSQNIEEPLSKSYWAFWVLSQPQVLVSLLCPFSAVFAHDPVITWLWSLLWSSNLAIVNGKWDGNSNPLRSRGWCVGQWWYFSFGESGPSCVTQGELRDMES